MKQKPLLTNLLLIATSIITLASTSGCAVSPEAKKKAREESLQKFARDVTKHLLDRNPDTLRESVNALMHTEVHTSALEKLQARKILPDSNIDVLRAISDAEYTKRTNEIEILSVRNITPLENDPVKIRVTGKEIFKVAGKQSEMRPFSLELTCRLTAGMDNLPTLIEVGGMSASTAFSAPPVSAPSKKKSRSRRG